MGWYAEKGLPEVCQIWKEGDMKFDPKAIDNMVADGKAYQDPQEPTLYFRNRKRKTWVCVKKVGGKTVWVTLGRYPDMPLSKARKAAAIEKANLLRGHEKKHASAFTLYDVFLKYADRNEQLRSLDAKRKRMNSSNLLALSGRPISEISSDDIRELKRRCRETPAMFNHDRALISTLFNFAIRELELELVNPVTAVAKYPQEPKSSFLPPELSEAFFAALSSGKYNEDFCDIMALLVDLGQRKGNVFAMEWDEIDFSCRVWVIPSKKSKNGKEMFIPLTPEAYDILERRRKNRKDKRWVFPRQKAPVLGETKAGYVRKKGEGHITDIRKSLKRLLHDIGAPENLTPHDFRRTHGTWMLNAGASIEQVSRSLNHSSIALTQKVYAKLLVGPVRAGQELMREKIRGMKRG